LKLTLHCSKFDLTPQPKKRRARRIGAGARIFACTRHDLPSGRQAARVAGINRALGAITAQGANVAIPELPDRTSEALDGTSTDVPVFPRKSKIYKKQMIGSRKRANLLPVAFRPVSWQPQKVGVFLGVFLGVSAGDSKFDIRWP
jgi:hypothetical protein